MNTYRVIFIVGLNTVERAVLPVARQQRCRPLYGEHSCEEKCALREQMLLVQENKFLFISLSI